MTVVSRLRKDAALWTVPGPRVAGPRGWPRIYGENRIDLAKRAGQRRGWTTEVFELYGKRVKKRYKTFVATWRPVSGEIRVVLVEEADGWVAFFCTVLLIQSTHRFCGRDKSFSISRRVKNRRWVRSSSPADS
jgi:hypothetical protein